MKIFGKRKTEKTKVKQEQMSHLKLLNEGLYSELYERLENEGFIYEIENIPNIEKEDLSLFKSIYAYLTYVMARNETVDIHLLICDMLTYSISFFHDKYTVIRWHLKRALEISPNNLDVLLWIVGIFSFDNPDSPFSHEELTEYNELLITLKRNDVVDLCD